MNQVIISSLASPGPCIHLLLSVSSSSAAQTSLCFSPGLNPLFLGSHVFFLVYSLLVKHLLLKLLEKGWEEGLLTAKSPFLILENLAPLQCSLGQKPCAIFLLISQVVHHLSPTSQYLSETLNYLGHLLLC